MERKIASFTVNHDTLVPGMYISRVDGDCVTYDLRLKFPNRGDYLQPAGMHTLEHLIATAVRFSDRGNEVIYFGPMGCRTGFYLILRDSVSKADAVKLVRNAFVWAADFEGDIPGAARKECGNWLEHDLENAKKEAKAYVEVLKNCSEDTMVYAE